MMWGRRCDDVVATLCVRPQAGRNRQTKIFSFVCYKRRSGGRQETGQDRNPIKKNRVELEGTTKNGFAHVPKRWAALICGCFFPHEHIEASNTISLMGACMRTKSAARFRELDFFNVAEREIERERTFGTRDGVHSRHLELRGLVASRPMVV